MKLRVARTIKWNVIDRVSSQLLYAVTGIILARELTQDDFGLIGAVLIFQSFAKRSEEHTSELKSLEMISYSVFCL